MYKLICILEKVLNIQTCFLNANFVRFQFFYANINYSMRNISVFKHMEVPTNHRWKAKCVTLEKRGN